MYIVVSLIMPSVRYGRNDHCDKLIVDMFPNGSKFKTNHLPIRAHVWMNMVNGKYM